MTHLAFTRSKQHTASSESPADPAYLPLAGSLTYAASGQHGLPALRRPRLLELLSVTRATQPEGMSGREAC